MIAHNFKSWLLKKVEYLMLYYLVPPKAQITCLGKVDGMGAQVHAIYSAMAYANCINGTYCHTPLKNVAHNYRNSPSWEKDIESFFGLSKESGGCEGKLFIGLTQILLVLLRRKLSQRKVSIILGLPHFHNFCDKNISALQELRPLLRENYFSNKNTAPPKKEYLTIAYHVRRGDVNSKTHPTRYTSNQVIKDRLFKLASVLDSADIEYEFHIYSQGTPDEFEGISSSVVLHLNGDPFEDHLALVNSDVFFMAKSSFSYTAALISSGEIIYENFWSPPLSDWWEYEDSLFNSPRFKSALLKRWCKLQNSLVTQKAEMYDND